MKYIDAERLKCELEKRLKNVRDYMNGAGMKYKGPKFFKAQGKESAYDAILNVLDSLQQEQPEVDLDFSMFAKEMDVVFNLPEEATKNTEQNPLNWEYAIARHFYELGLNARKEDNK